MYTTNKRFTNSEIEILECGVKWMKEAGEGWYTRLYYLLANRSQGIHAFLRLTEPMEFGKNLIYYLTAVLGELRSCGRIKTSFNNLWPDHAGVILNPLDRGESIEMAEAFLEGFSELAEEAWSPAMENTWRKAVMAMLESCVGSPEVSPKAKHSHSFILAV